MVAMPTSQHTGDRELVAPSSLIARARAPRPTLAGPFDVKDREVAPLAASTVRLARAVTEAMFATGEGPPPADRLEWVTTELRGFLGHSPDASRVFRLCLFLVTGLGPLLSLRLGFASHHPSPIHAHAPHTHHPAVFGSHHSGSAIRRAVRLSR